MSGELAAVLGVSWEDIQAGGAPHAVMDAREMARQEKEYFKKRMAEESGEVTACSLTKEECFRYGISWEKIRQQQMEYIRQNYGCVTNVEMAVRLNKTVPMVNYMLRKLGIRRKKQYWSESEKELLSELWGQKSVMDIARRLGRTETAILIKASRMRLGPTKSAQGKMTANELAKALGINNNKNIYRWIQKHGLKCKHKVTRIKAKYYLIEIDEFWKWGEKNQYRFDSHKFEPMILGKEPDWMTEKRKSNPTRSWPGRWTAKEDDMLREMFKTCNYTYQQIAGRMGRTKNAVGNRLRKIKVWE